MNTYLRDGVGPVFAEYVLAEFTVQKFRDAIGDPEDRRQHAHRDDEDDRERQRQTLVLRGQDEEHLRGVLADGQPERRALDVHETQPARAGWIDAAIVAAT